MYTLYMMSYIAFLQSYVSIPATAGTENGIGCSPNFLTGNQNSLFYLEKYMYMFPDLHDKGGTRQ